MKRTGLLEAMTVVVALSLLLLFSSCVNEEYTLSEDRVNLEMTVFQDGLSVPLGSTSKIMLKDIKDSLLANVEDESLLKYFTVGANGEYGVALSDRMDLSDTLNNLLSNIEIPDVAISEAFSFNLNSVDVSSLKIPEAEYENTFHLGDEIDVPELSFDGFDTSFTIYAGLHGYKPDAETLKLNLPEVTYSDDIAELKKKDKILEINALPMLWDTQVGIGSIGQFVSDWNLEEDMPIVPGFGPVEKEVSFEMSLPAGITSVEDIVLQEGAKLVMSVGFTNSFFTDGKIELKINEIDVSKIFDVVSGDNDVDDKIGGVFKVPVNGNEAVMEFEIGDLVLSDDDWTTAADGSLKLSKNLKLNVKGEIDYDADEIKTTVNHLKGCATSDQKMGFFIEMKFVNFQVDDVKMTLDQIEVPCDQMEVPFKQTISLDSPISDIDYVTLSDDSKITMSIVPNAMPDGFELKLASLKLTFPEGIEVEGAQNRVLEIVDVDLSDGYSREIKIERITLPEPDGGKITLDEDVIVEAVVNAGGTVGCADLPDEGEPDLSVTVKVEAVDLVIDDYSVSITGYEYPIDFGQEFKFDVTGMEEFGTVNVIPDGDPEIVVNIMLPNTGMEIVADPEENLVITFPQMLKFRKEALNGYNYDETKGTITIIGELPSEIRLPIDCLEIAPVKGDDGKYWAGGNFAVSGGVTIPAGSITKEDITALTAPECVVGMSAVIPEIRLGTLAMDKPYEKLIEKNFEIGMMSIDDLPEQLVSIDCVEFEDVYFTMNLDATKLPDLGTTTLSLDFEIDLPEMIVLDSDNIKEGNVLSVRGELDKSGMIVVEPVRIAALDLSEIDLKDLENLKDIVTINGKVVLDNIALDINEWLGKNLEVKVDAGIKDIVISKVLGKVDVQIPAVETSLDLTPYKGYLKGDNVEITGIENLISKLNIAAEIKTNVGVPLGAKLVITPYSGGNAAEAWSTDITLNHSESAADTTYTRYWLSLDEESMSEDRPQGYTHIHLPVREYLKDMPDSLNIVVEAGSDPSKTCVVEPTQKYVVEAAYSVAIPFEFGDGAAVTYRDTIPEIPEMVEQLLAMGGLVLTGEVTSSLPFEISMKVNLLDNDGAVIPLDETASVQKISGCSPDGEHAVTNLYLGLQKKEGTEVEGVSAIELEFNLAAVAGVPLSDKCFIQASLQALVPEGITVDAKELMNGKEE
ncbi:MAG: hypothetical protein IKV05_02975 [Bacteroidales bacterium]|nr:hypothetical protein [Bacteroidales bacterium]